MEMRENLDEEAKGRPDNFLIGHKLAHRVIAPFIRTGNGVQKWSASIGSGLPGLDRRYTRPWCPLMLSQLYDGSECQRRS